MRIAGKVALITGGGGGIGGGMAEALAEAGARIILADVSMDHAREQADRLEADAEVELVALDVTSLESWADARRQAEARFGAVDILCNNAGVSAPFMPLIDMAPEDFERVLAVNLSGVFNGIKTFARGMVDRGAGHIVNTSSVNGLLPNAGSATYSASKFAVTALSDALREELAPAGVGVSTVFPGLTRSRMVESDMAALAVTDPDHAARILSTMIEPIAVGKAVVEAIETDRRYVVSHPAYKTNLVARTDAVLQAFDDAG